MCPDLPPLRHAPGGRPGDSTRAVNGDQSAAVFAFGWPEEDTAYVNIGTSAFVQRVLTRDPGYVPRQLTGIILDDGATTVYTVEGNVNGAGTALEWLRGELGIEDVVTPLPQWLETACEPPLSSMASPASAARSGNPISLRASSAQASPGRRPWPWSRASPSCCRRT